jgi:hypothetical protein
LAYPDLVRLTPPPGKRALCNRMIKNKYSMLHQTKKKSVIFFHNGVLPINVFKEFLYFLWSCIWSLGKNVKENLIIVNHL